ncbi:MAG: hypothetical protein HY556_11535 [Euryarchaeota archaeon]|nr:hypothetical protein [Euryarchaeota archaeon]
MKVAIRSAVVVGGYPPSESGSTGNVLKALIGGAPTKPRMVAYTVKPRKAEEESKTNGMKLVHLSSRLSTPWIARALASLGADATLEPSPRRLARMLDEHEIDRLLLHPNGDALLDFYMAALCRRLNKRVDLRYWLGDYTIWHSRTSKNPLFHRARMAALRSIASRASARFSGSNASSLRYSAQFGHPVRVQSTPLQDSVIDAAWKWTPFPRDVNEPFRIFLPGTPRPHFRQNISILGAAIAKLRTASAKKIELVTCGDWTRDLLTSWGVRDSQFAVHGWVRDRDTVLELASQCDCIYLPDSLDESYETSIDAPSRMVDCLAAGPPIVIHGSASSFVIRYFNENALRFCETGNAPERLAATFLDVLALPIHEIQDLHKKYLTIANRNHRASTAWANLMGDLVES